jgi:hypothetical protein
VKTSNRREGQKEINRDGQDRQDKKQKPCPDEWFIAFSLSCSSCPSLLIEFSFDTSGTRAI